MKLPADRPILFLKAHVNGYTKTDGTVVASHERIVRNPQHERIVR